MLINLIKILFLTTSLYRYIAMSDIRGNLITDLMRVTLCISQ